MNVRAFSDPQYNYYELTKSLGLEDDGRYLLPAGSIFYHDKNDSVKGSIGAGCLKLCWTPDGNCYGRICGDCMAFHASFKDTNLFKLVQPEKVNEEIKKLKEIAIHLEYQLDDLKEKIEQMTQ